MEIFAHIRTAFAGSSRRHRVEQVSLAWPESPENPLDVPAKVVMIPVEVVIITTDALDVAAHEAIIARGGYPSPLHYRGFPKSLCTSVNEVICHGIPDDQQLQDGDVQVHDVAVLQLLIVGDA